MQQTIETKTLKKWSDIFFNIENLRGTYTSSSLESVSSIARVTDDHFYKALYDTYKVRLHKKSCIK